VQAAPLATHTWPEQQLPEAQVLLAQQGVPCAPHGWKVPATQTFAGSAPASPEGMQTLPSRQAPAPQPPVGHGAW